jgi:hypothetical protein
MDHTPGPWATEYYEDSINIVSTDPNPELYITLLAHPETGELTEQDWANARLVAAAPELLEALKLMLKAYQDGVFTMPGYTPLLERVSEAAHAAKDAIAKAEGR